jgi:Xaa-Pro aminopeptidase
MHTDWAYLEQEFGCSIREHFLMAVRSLDNPKAVTPFLLLHDGRRYGLFLHVEKGNVEAARLPPDIAQLYYRPYFTFQPDEAAAVYRSLGDAIENAGAGERNIIIDVAAPIALAAELSERFSLSLEDGPEIGSVTARQFDCAHVAERLRRGRPQACQAAARLLERSPAKTGLLPFLTEHEDRRFAALDVAIADAGLAGVLVSSTLNVQEIAGVPVGAKHRPLAAFYAPRERHAWVLYAGVAQGGRQFASPKAALEHIAPAGMLGVETEDLSVGLARALGIDQREWRPADRDLRRWRDENTLPDLPYYIIASRTTRHAIDTALGFATRALEQSAPVTEMDAYWRYLAAMREFAPAALAGARATRTLTNFHCGARTIFPANAAAHRLDASINTLKIDAGCLLFDDEGFLLGCSDIARTVCLSQPARELYALFEKNVRRRLIPGMRAGRAGEELHAEATRAVWDERAKLGANPLFVDLKAPQTEYDRDVGHLLGKNNLAHLRLVRGEKNALREGMIACCEYQWPLAGHAIAYEDTCLVSAAGGLNITSDEE